MFKSDEFGAGLVSKQTRRTHSGGAGFCGDPRFASSFPMRCKDRNEILASGSKVMVLSKSRGKDILNNRRWATLLHDLQTFTA